MLTTVILIIKQFISSIMPRGVKLDSVLREICCHDLISSLEKQEDKLWCDEAELKVTLGWSQLWARVGDNIHAAANMLNVSSIQELKAKNNETFNSRKRSELEFTFRDTILRPWVIFRQAVGDDIQFYFAISCEMHNESSGHCAFFYEKFETKRKVISCLLSA